MKLTPQEFQAKYGATPSVFSTPQASTRNNPFQKAGDFLGISAVGEAVGAGAALAGKAGQQAQQSNDTLRTQADRLMATAQKYQPNDPKRTFLIQEAQKAYQQAGVNASDISNIGPTTQQWAGGMLNLAGTLAGAGSVGAAAKGARTASLLRTVAKPTTKALLTQAATQGALQGAGSSVSKGKTSLGELIASTLGGAALGAGTAGALKLAGGAMRGINNTVSERFPKYWYKASTGLSRNTNPEFLLNQKGANRLTGKADVLLEKAKRVITQSEAKIQAHPDINKPVNLGKVLQDPGLQEFIDAQSQNNPAGFRTIQKTINNWLGRGPKNVTEKTIDELRKMNIVLRKQISGTVLGGGSIPTSVDALAKHELSKAITNTIRTESPDIGNLLLKEESPVMQLIGNLQKYMAGATTKVKLSPTAMAQEGLQIHAPGTRLAKGAWTLGKLGRTLESGIKKTEKNAPQQVRNILRSLLISSLNQ